MFHGHWVEAGFASDHTALLALGTWVTSLASVVVCLTHYGDGPAGRQEALVLESHGLGSMSSSDTCRLCNPARGLPMYLKSKEFAC